MTDAEIQEALKGRRFYDMLGDWRNVHAFIQEVGPEEYEKHVIAEIRVAMDECGVRAVLWYGEKMEDVAAMMQEFTPGVPLGPHVEG
jgi:hypothetical protein